MSTKFSLILKHTYSHLNVTHLCSQKSHAVHTPKSRLAVLHIHYILLWSYNHRNISLCLHLISTMFQQWLHTLLLMCVFKTTTCLQLLTTIGICKWTYIRMHCPEKRGRANPEKDPHIIWGRLCGSVRRGCNTFHCTGNGHTASYFLPIPFWWVDGLMQAIYFSNHASWNVPELHIYVIFCLIHTLLQGFLVYSVTKSHMYSYPVDLSCMELRTSMHIFFNAAFISDVVTERYMVSSA